MARPLREGGGLPLGKGLATKKKDRFLKIKKNILEKKTVFAASLST